MTSQKTTTINGHEVPETLREAPPCGTEYFVPVFSPLGISIDSYIWGDDRTDGYFLKRGLVHLTEAAAEAHAKALLSFTETK